MKVKGQILICTVIMLNDHSNPYIESTTVLSDIYIHRQRSPVVRLGGLAPARPITSESEHYGRRAGANPRVWE